MQLLTIYRNDKQENPTRHQTLLCRPASRSPLRKLVEPNWGCFKRVKLLISLKKSFDVIIGECFQMGIADAVNAD